MFKIVGGHHLRLLWADIQKLQPDENGNIIFNFARFKRIHDIAPDAEPEQEQEI
jgi:hypothetical protein